MVAAGGYSLQAPGGGAMVPCRAHVRHVVTDDRMVRRGPGAGADGALGFVLRGARVIPLAPGITFAVVEIRRGLGDLRQG